MPIIYHERIEPKGELGLWQITETEEELATTVDLSPEEKVQLARIKGHRRVEYLAVRRLVHDMSGRFQRAHFVKDAYGKPHLQDSDWHISVSHSRTVCAAIAAPQPVGVDIQQVVEKIDRLASKFMRPIEMESLQPDTRLLHLHVYWCAKEALYKAYGRRELDFCAHLLIAPFSYSAEGGRFTGQVCKGDLCQTYTLHYSIEEDFVLVYAVMNTVGGQTSSSMES